MAEQKPTPGRGELRRPATIADVAQHAGVGVGTVSRVLNDRKNVSVAAANRVLEAIAEIDYQPSHTARNLSLGRTHTIAVVIPFITSPSVAERLQGLLQQFSSSEYVPALYDVSEPERRDDALHRLTGRSFADGGIIVSYCPDDELVAAFEAAGIPVVLLDAAHPGLPYVAIDNVLGGRLAVEHLLALGHRRIAFLDEGAYRLGFAPNRDRLTGYLQALAAAGVEPRPEYVTSGPPGRDIAHSLTESLLALLEPPTAIFAASDTLALGVLEVANLAGVDVPGDLTVVGFDDIEVASYVGSRRCASRCTRVVRSPDRCFSMTSPATSRPVNRSCFLSRSSSGGRAATSHDASRHAGVGDTPSACAEADGRAAGDRPAPRRLGDLSRAARRGRHPSDGRDRPPINGGMSTCANAPRTGTPRERRCHDLRCAFV